MPEIDIGAEWKSHEPEWWIPAMFWMCRLFFQRLIFKARLLTAFIYLTLINVASVFANDITEINVTEEDGVYFIKAIATDGTVLMQKAAF